MTAVPAPLPPSAPGLRIGLFGGSFNPPHEGHRLVALQCLKRLRLDAVWVLVSPGNPLKDNSSLPSIGERIAAVTAVMDHPRIHATGLEADRGLRYTWQTVEFVTRVLPDRRFVWIMGADSFRDFDKWQHWQRIAATLPMAIYARPGSALRAPLAKAGTALARYRLEESDAEVLANCRPPAWVFLSGLMSGVSSTQIRAARAKTTVR